MYLLIFQILLFNFCIFEINCQNPEVTIPQGTLLGATRINLDDGLYYSFQNIPYGKPPIGELRFKAPEPADSWEGTRDATQDLPSCVQEGGGQEDCLYLNVYTPVLADENITQLPVMVWIHGGKFVSGSASEESYGAQFLLTNNVILVAINYRVGIFGFLTLDDPYLGVTGNAGMKDQVLALEWVRDNIEYFGGDPNNVMIFGESAGSSAVQLLLLSPTAKGLFHKAICQSGDMLTEIKKLITRNNGEVVAQALGMQTENWEEMLVSLQQASASDLLAATSNLNTNYYKPFVGPIVEISNEVAFLDREPIDIIRTGSYNQVPFIMGVNDAEGLVFQYYTRRDTGESILIDDFTEFVPTEFNIEGTIAEDLISFIIHQFYYGDTQPSRDDISQAVALTTDYAYVFPSYRSVREYSHTAQNPIYFYYFTAITELNSFRRRDETVAEFPGTAHADDLGYLFYMEDTPSFDTGSVEERGLRNLVNLWTNFAIYGNPTPENSRDFIWDPVTEDEFNYLHIGTEETHMLHDAVFTSERMEFWWSLYEQYARK